MTGRLKLLASKGIQLQQYYIQQLSQKINPLRLFYCRKNINVETKGHESARPSGLTQQYFKRFCVLLTRSKKPQNHQDNTDKNWQTTDIYILYRLR
jgi:hypothetical protein